MKKIITKKYSNEINNNHQIYNNEINNINQIYNSNKDNNNNKNKY